ncbi:DUF2946 domain-containing protein [Erwinia aphidicola]|uniref:DUF2946 domain-containing protein n=1 Tax=Erwinia aphidicola TaxID=68334 RepID=UPI0030CA7811
MSLCEFSYTRSRQAAWLGLLAILLLFVAPVISKSLADRRGGDSMMMHHAMGMEMEMGGLPAMDQPMPDHHPLSMMDDSACGYCVLLAHLPLDMLVLPLLWSALQAAKPPQLPLVQSVAARIVPRYFHPRAPPQTVAFL